MRCRLRLESFRDRIANFLEKVAYWIRLSDVSAQKEERDGQRRNAARTSEVTSGFIGVQCEAGIVLQNRGVCQNG